MKETKIDYAIIISIIALVIPGLVYVVTIANTVSQLKDSKVDKEDIADLRSMLGNHATIIEELKSGKMIDEQKDKAVVEINKVASDITNNLPIVPVGTIVAYWGEGDPPAGWLFCNGDVIDKGKNVKYSELIDHLNILDITRNNATSIATLPDLRGVFVRGCNSGRNDKWCDPELNDRVSVDDKTKYSGVGSYQISSFEKHFHSLRLTGAAGNSAYEVRGPSWGYDDWHGDATVAPTDDKGKSETRPNNIAVNYIIKY